MAYRTYSLFGIFLCLTLNAVSKESVDSKLALSASLLAEGPAVVFTPEKVCWIAKLCDVSQTYFKQLKNMEEPHYAMSPTFKLLSISFQNFGNWNDFILQTAGIEVSDFCSSDSFGQYFCKACGVGPFHVPLMQGCIWVHFAHWMKQEEGMPLTHIIQSHPANWGFEQRGDPYQWSKTPREIETRHKAVPEFLLVC